MVLFVSEIVNGLLSLILLIKETKLKIDFNNWIIKPFFSILLLNCIFSYSNYIHNFMEFIFYGFIFVIVYLILLVLLRSLLKKDIIIIRGNPQL